MANWPPPYVTSNKLHKKEQACSSRVIIANSFVCLCMPRPRANDTELDKLARFERIKKAITALEKQQALLLKQGDLAPQGAWVARYQVRQNLKKYWY